MAINIQNNRIYFVVDIPSHLCQGVSEQCCGTYNINHKNLPKSKKRKARHWYIGVTLNLERNETRITYKWLQLWDSMMHLTCPSCFRFVLFLSEAQWITGVEVNIRSRRTHTSGVSVFERWNTLWCICCPCWMPVWTGGTVGAKWTQRKWLHNDQHIITLHMSTRPSIQGQFSFEYLLLSADQFHSARGCLFWWSCCIPIEMFWSTVKDLTLS